MSKLLSSSEMKTLLEKELKVDTEVVLLSAFFTAPALEWLKKSAVTQRKIKLVVRASPSDIAAGGTDISALRGAVRLGWDVRCISSLHAKVYLIGEKIFVGSGNLTANGMALFGGGNLELNTLLDSDEKSQALVHKIFLEGQSLDEKILDAMSQFVQPTGNTGAGGLVSWWPENVLPQEKRDLFCSDFPQEGILQTKITKLAPWHEIAELYQAGNIENARKALEASVAVSWLDSCVGEELGDYTSFGALTANLHKELVEDPSPYRRTVKMLLANLLSFVDELGTPTLVVSRQRHRQIVSRR